MTRTVESHIEFFYCKRQIQGKHAKGKNGEGWSAIYRLLLEEKIYNVKEDCSQVGKWERNLLNPNVIFRYLERKKLHASVKMSNIYSCMQVPSKV